MTKLTHSLIQSNNHAKTSIPTTVNEKRTPSQSVPTGPPSIENDAQGTEKLLLKKLK